MVSSAKAATSLSAQAGCKGALQERSPEPPTVQYRKAMMEDPCFRKGGRRAGSRLRNSPVGPRTLMALSSFLFVSLCVETAWSFSVGPVLQPFRINKDRTAASPCALGAGTCLRKCIGGFGMPVIPVARGRAGRIAPIALRMVAEPRATEAKVFTEQSAGGMFTKVIMEMEVRFFHHSLICGYLSGKNSLCPCPCLAICRANACDAIQNDL